MVSTGDLEDQNVYVTGLNYQQLQKRIQELVERVERKAETG